MSPVLRKLVYLSFLSAVVAFEASAADFLGKRLDSEQNIRGESESSGESQSLPKTQQPVERIPGFSQPSYTGHFDEKGRHVITQIDRNSDTVKGWMREGVITESQVKQIEQGKPAQVDLPDAH